MADYWNKPIMKQYMTKLKEACKVFGILVIGETGTGKSTLVNNLLGKEVAKVGEGLQSETETVSKYTMTVGGVTVTVYDTPGLSDSRCGRDHGYLRQMENILRRGEIQLVIYCFSLTETKMRESLVSTFQEFNKIGVKWEYTVIALTFADCLPVKSKERKTPGFRMDTLFNRKVMEWDSQLRKTLTQQVRVADYTVREISIRPTTSQFDEFLPNGERWYVPLWLDILGRLAPAAMARFIEMHKYNITEAKPPQQTQQVACVPQKVKIELDAAGVQTFQRVVRKALVTAGLVAAGGGVGAALGTVVLPGIGTAVGTAIGAGVGMLSAAVISWFK